MHTHTDTPRNNPPTNRFAISLRLYTPHKWSCNHIWLHTQTHSNIRCQAYTAHSHTHIHTHTGSLHSKANDSSVPVTAFISLLTYVFTQNLGSKWVPTEHVIWGFSAICLLQKFCLCVRFWHEWNAAHTRVYIANKSQNVDLTAG